MDIQVDVVVVGAGGGGAVLGLLLAKKGIRTLVFEQAGGPPFGIRGEILQPNGQKILDDLGLLDQLPRHAVQPVRHFHFRQIGGERLCSIDYDELPTPYNRALVTLPHVVHRTVLEALEKQNPGGLWYNASFTKVLKKDKQIMGVEADVQGKTVRISAKLVVGADGPASKVRSAHSTFPPSCIAIPKAIWSPSWTALRSWRKRSTFSAKKKFWAYFRPQKRKFILFT